jgi:hypothetical protein
MFVPLGTNSEMADWFEGRNVEITEEVRWLSAATQWYILKTALSYWHIDSRDINGARGGAVGWGTTLQAGRSRVRFPMGSLEFLSDLILLVTQPLNRNEYQESFLGDKDGRCVGLTPADCLGILGVSTSWSPEGLPRPVVGQLYLFCVTSISFLTRSRLTILTKPGGGTLQPTLRPYFLILCNQE